MDLTLHTLPNGIRLVHLPTASAVAHCGIIINAGSRDELPEEHGVAHFIEHMLFKGTTRRKSYHILSRLEDVGGELNAYTTKEETAIHASFLKEHYVRAMELVADLLFSSTFPPAELEKEKEVVIEEINSYLDSPAEYIFDEFEEMVFPDQPIGRSILGIPSTVRTISGDTIRTFITRNYSTSQMVFCSVGAIRPKQIITLFEKYFGHVPAGSDTRRKRSEYRYKPVSSEKNTDTWQNHCIIGNIAYDLHDRRRMGLFMLNNILGGQGMNSRLNLSLREKRGYAYNVESVYNPYTDTGLVTIYFGTDSRNLRKSIDLIHSELDRLRRQPLGTLQLSRAKSQIKGYLARAYENHESLMLSLGKSLLIFDRIDSMDETFRKIDAVTGKELTETAAAIFDRSSLSTLIYRQNGERT
ncbi:insulinase family protein [bacterium]|nr:insulinase family protein [bacterium]